MPAYRFIKPLPDELIYRNGTRFLVQRFSGVYTRWSLSLRKEPAVPYQAVVLCTALDEEKLSHAMAEGFVVPEGGREERVMETLCRRGFAERLLPLD